MTNTESRRWSFPDGVDRVISYRRAVWSTFDWLRDEEGWTEGRLSALAFSAALEFASRDSDQFEAKLRQCLKGLIRNVHLTYLAQEPGNDN